MLIKIHQIRDRIYAYEQCLKRAKLELEVEIKNCNHIWVTVDDPFPMRICDLCGENAIEQYEGK